MTDSSKRWRFKPLQFEQVLDQELEYFKQREEQQTQERKPGYADTNHECGSDDSAKIIAKAHKARLTGLAFSGGGIRSATFNLGVLQALARLKLLGQFDYLSTVSGGGYIGSWFVAWVHRATRAEKQEPTEESKNSKTTMDSRLETVTNELSSSVSVSACDDDRPRAAMQPDPAPIWHLREYSNYLSPRIGLWSTDTWTIGITYIRNFFLTLSLLLTTLITLVLFVRIATLFYFKSAQAMEPYDSAYVIIPVLFCLSIFLTTMLGGIELCGNSRQEKRKIWVSYVAVSSMMIAAVTGSLWLWHSYTSPQEMFSITLNQILPWNLSQILLEFASDSIVFTQPFAFIALFVTSGWFLGMIIGGFNCRKTKVDAEDTTENAAPATTSRFTWVLWFLIAAPIVCLSVLFGLLALLGQWMQNWLPAETVQPWAAELWYIVVWGPALMVLVFSIVALVFVGVTGNILRELDREWLARFFAVLSKWMVLLTSLTALVVYSPWLVGLLDKMPLANISITAVWGILSTAGAYLTRTLTADKSSMQGWIRKTILITAPYIFILGMIILTIWLTEVSIQFVHAQILHDEFYDYLSYDPSKYWESLIHINIGALSLMLLGTAVFTFLWSQRVGVNRFSLHSMYADRLIRAYLGASNLKRNAHPFTGFDNDDNEIHMHDLVHEPTAAKNPDSGKKEKICTEPYLIINAAINLVSSKRLAWQKRKAASFTFTPKYCGYEFCGDNGSDNHADKIGRVGGFIESSRYAGKGEGVSLGKAMTISGAAASPNMGYHSSPALTFLMTTFNIRLGWWLPNTASKDRNLAARSEPRLGLLYLWNELLGRTNANSDYIYLSDGGHFENLGIYELVRRRCRIIVACDAEADPDMTFSGLGNAIEKCQIDLGVPIDIDVSQIKPDKETGNSLWHCAVGCIRYSEADRDQPDGTLLYIKASLTGDEPMNVETYANSHQDFPHESTADQWFDESQFESYRALGEHITYRVLENAINIASTVKDNNQNRVERVIVELRKQWYAGADVQGKVPADHDALLEAILDTLRTGEHLAFLDCQLYPNLSKVSDEYYPSESGKFLPANYAQFRAGFYFCKRLIQFMQQVYYDRHLDLEHAAPGNRGWMNLFRRWSWSRMLRFTWSVTAGTYGARFQSFCEHHLSLDTGEPEFNKEPLTIIVAINRIPDDKPDQYDVSLLQVSNGNNTEEIDWDKAQLDFGIHIYETQIIREFINAYVRQKNLHDCPSPLRFDIYPLKFATSDPVTDDDNKVIKLNAGFLITGPSYLKTINKKSCYENAVLYFRIRSSMRNMDLSRKAFIECRKHDALKKWRLINLDISTDTGRRRKYRDVYSMEKDSLDHCRWYSKLLAENKEVDESPVDE